MQPETASLRVHTTTRVSLKLTSGNHYNFHKELDDHRIVSAGARIHECLLYYFARWVRDTTTMNIQNDNRSWDMIEYRCYEEQLIRKNMEVIG